ncbi:MAG: IS91 family transposase [Acetobacteraceae bacterium]|nr:IS91 family transposase [Acetobacteraceae bacterium]
MDRPQWEVAEVFRRYGDAYRQAHGASLSPAQRRVMSAIECCRTAALGGHLEQCDRCGHQRNAYNSCGDRHCPKCQSLARAQWLEARRAELLDTEYFHVVFTLPDQIASIAYQNQTVLYGLLFRAAAETLRTIAADPQYLGAEIGFFAVLHTWGQTLTYHPHLHCVVSGGGLSPDGTQWVSCRAGFFLPVRVLSRLFRRLFLEGLVSAFEAGHLPFFAALEPLRDRASFLRYVAPTREADWVVYAKRPFAGPEQVLDYVGRYTHRVAISNNRLLDLADGQVSFRYKDYRHNAQPKTMTLDAEEFIRRFLLHVLPAGFQRIRYYGFLGNRYRKEKLARCRHLLGMPADEAGPAKAAAPVYQERYEALTGASLRRCPVCHEGCMQVIEILPPSRRNRGTAINDTS